MKLYRFYLKKNQGVPVKVKSDECMYICVHAYICCQLKYSFMHECVGMCICTRNWLGNHETHSPGH